MDSMATAQAPSSGIHIDVTALVPFCTNGAIHTTGLNGFEPLDKPAEQPLVASPELPKSESPAPLEPAQVEGDQAISHAELYAKLIADPGGSDLLDDPKDLFELAQRLKESVPRTNGKAKS